MRNSIKRLHDEDDALIKAMQEEHEEADRTCRKEYEMRHVDETVTDVKAAIRQLPRRYFKEVTTNTNICLQNTQSGLKTIIGRIKRVKRKKVQETQQIHRMNKLLIAGVIAIVLGIIASIAYFLVNSLLDSYNPSTVVLAPPTVDPGNQ